jgi:hypothetical protein
MDAQNSNCSFYFEFKKSRLYAAWLNTKLSEAIDRKMLPLFLPILLAAKSATELEAYIKNLPRSKALDKDLQAEFQKMWRIMRANNEETAVLHWLWHLDEAVNKWQSGCDSLDMHNWCKVKEAKKFITPSYLNAHYYRVNELSENRGYHNAIVEMADGLYGVAISVYFEKESSQILVLADFGRIDSSIIRLIKKLPDEFRILLGSLAHRVQLVYDFPILGKEYFEFSNWSAKFEGAALLKKYHEKIEDLLGAKGLEIILRA